MAFGINNATTVNISDIIGIGNVTEFPEFLINVNHTVYGGWMYFFLMITLFVILFVAANKVKDQPLNNAMYSAGFVSILGFFLRAVEVIKNGASLSLLTDFQMWIFPLIAIILASTIWAIKD